MTATDNTERLPWDCICGRSNFYGNRSCTACFTHRQVAKMLIALRDTPPPDVKSIVKQLIASLAPHIEGLTSKVEELDAAVREIQDGNPALRDIRQRLTELTDKVSHLEEQLGSAETQILVNTDLPNNDPAPTPSEEELVIRYLMDAEGKTEEEARRIAPDLPAWKKSLAQLGGA